MNFPVNFIGRKGNPLRPTLFPAQPLHQRSGERAAPRASVKQANLGRVSLKQRCHERPNRFWSQELTQFLFLLGMTIGGRLGTGRLKDGSSR